MHIPLYENTDNTTNRYNKSNIALSQITGNNIWNNCYQFKCKRGTIAGNWTKKWLSCAEVLNKDFNFEAKSNFGGCAGCIAAVQSQYGFQEQLENKLSGERSLREWEWVDWTSVVGVENRKDACIHGLRLMEESNEIRAKFRKVEHNKRSWTKFGCFANGFFETEFAI